MPSLHSIIIFVERRLIAQEERRYPHVITSMPVMGRTRILVPPVLGVKIDEIKAKKYVHSVQVAYKGDTPAKDHKPTPPRNLRVHSFSVPAILSFHSNPLHISHTLKQSQRCSPAATPVPRTPRPHTPRTKNLCLSITSLLRRSRRIPLHRRPPESSEPTTTWPRWSTPPCP